MEAPAAQDSAWAYTGRLASPAIGREIFATRPPEFRIYEDCLWVS
jgi:hypothetical protein